MPHRAQLHILYRSGKAAHPNPSCSVRTPIRFCARDRACAFIVPGAIDSGQVAGAPYLARLHGGQAPHPRNRPLAQPFLTKCCLTWDMALWAAIAHLAGRGQQRPGRPRRRRASDVLIAVPLPVVQVIFVHLKLRRVDRVPQQPAHAAKSAHELAALRAGPAERACAGRRVTASPVPRDTLVPCLQGSACGYLQSAECTYWGPQGTEELNDPGAVQRTPLHTHASLLSCVRLSKHP